MRIAFCTSSLEPGRDLVGDYTRRLAAACCACGHDCVLLGLADRHIQHPKDEVQPVLGVRLGTLRLPESLNWEQRVALAGAWLKNQSPHWISLQFPAISFPKELVGNLAPHIVNLVDGGCALHLMLHERTMGTGTETPRWQRLLIGSPQRRATLTLLRQLRPDAVHVSGDAGMRSLERYGVPHARVLTLPSGVLAQPNDAPESSMAAIAVQFLSDIGARSNRGYETGTKSS